MDLITEHISQKSSFLQSDKVNILLVDDEPRNLFTLETVLAPLNENLVMATSGKDALKEILKRQFALILLDVKMPGIDGYEVAELIRRRQESRKTPIIFITGYNQDDMEVFRGYEMGAVDYLVKPVQPQILYSKVKVFVDLHRKTVALENQRRIAVAELRKNRELNKTNKLLEQVKLEAEQFASIASHDLQTPLRHIASYVEVLREECGDTASAEQKEAIEIITAGTMRMKALIGDLLSLSRIGSHSIELCSVDLNILLEEVIDMLEVQIEASKATITVEPLPTLIVDAGRMRQVFQNLIGNALKYRSPERTPQISIYAKETLRDCQISVSDNGIGIDKEHFSRVFEVFQRLHMQDAYSGTGIGLSICKKIINLHGGHVWLDSELGQGSTFHFKIARNLRKEQIL